jgi:hypothetical protein
MQAINLYGMYPDEIQEMKSLMEEIEKAGGILD